MSDILDWIKDAALIVGMILIVVVAIAAAYFFWVLLTMLACWAFGWHCEVYKVAACLTVAHLIFGSGSRSSKS